MKTGACVVIGLVLIMCSEVDSRKSYEGHQVYNVHITNLNDGRVISNLIDKYELDVWHQDRWVGGNVSIHLSPNAIPDILKLFQAEGLHYGVVMGNVQDVINEEEATVKKTRDRRATWFNRMAFNSHQKINNFIGSLAKKCATCSQRNIGTTMEGRKIKVFKISSGPNKPIIFIDGGFHAREWISPATVINIMYRLAMDKSVGYLVELFDWYFVPVVNPDGYTYSRTTDRMWRKNRSMHPSSSCRGTDLNRNFDQKWGYVGASSDPCYQTFRGTSPFSEPESRALKNYIERFKGRTKAYLTFHSYGQYLLYPWGYAGCKIGKPTDAADLQDLAGSTAKAIADASDGLHSRYVVGQSGCLLGPASGCSDDWAKDKAGIKYSYTVELPDRGGYGFFSPVNNIKPVFKETFEGVRAFAKNLKRKLV